MIRFSTVVRPRLTTYFQRGIPLASAMPGTRQAGAEHQVGAARPGSAPPCCRSARARTGRPGGASPRRQRRAAAPPGSRSSGSRRSPRCAGARPRAAAACGPAPRCRRSEASSTRTTSSTQSRGIASTVPRACARRSWPASPRSPCPGAGQHAGPPRTRCRRARAATSAAVATAATGTAAIAGRPARAARAAPASGGCAPPGAGSRRRGRGARGACPTRPWSQPNSDLAAAPVAHPRDLEAQRAQPGAQRARRQVDEVARKVEVKPAVPEQAGLQAVGVGHRHEQHSRRGSGAAPAWSMAWPGRGQVLQRVPEDHRRPAAPRARRRRPRARRRGASRARARAPRARGRTSASSSVPSPAPTSSTGPGGAIRSTRRASRARVRRRTASPIPEKRPDSGR